jgi:hypothetical protein
MYHGVDTNRFKVVRMNQAVVVWQNLHTPMQTQTGSNYKVMASNSILKI